MKRFDFPLERVRRWRQSQAELEEFKLQQLVAGLRSLEEQKKQLWAEHQLAQTASLSSANPDSAELSWLDSFSQHIRQRSHALDQLRMKQEISIANQRERVIAARRRFELLDRLGKRALAEWQHAFNREQETLASELFLAKRNRGA